MIQVKSILQMLVEEDKLVKRYNAMVASVELFEDIDHDDLADEFLKKAKDAWLDVEICRKELAEVIDLIREEA
jgi:hypothetical protein